MISPAAKHTYTTKDTPNHPRNPFDVEKQKIESFAHKRENIFFLYGRVEERHRAATITDLNNPYNM